jgi:uncharacterized protein (DUF362 family)
MYDVAVVKYEKPVESLKKVVDLAGGLGDISGGSKVFIKPNFVMWVEGVNFPKYGILTTARLIEDTVILLKEHGAQDITIVEGIVEMEKKSASLLQLAAKGMGLDILAKRYGVKLIDVHRGAFTKVTAGDVKLSVNADILDADYIVNIPVLKTHNQSIVSLGIKNLKGLLNIASRKRCHNADQSIDLDYHLAKLPEIVRPSLTVIDGIYSLERGPAILGEAHRSNILIASKDLISADKVGATILGIDPQTVPHITLSARSKNRPTDLSDVNVRGDVDIKTATKPHEIMSAFTESGDMPLMFELMGIQGIRFPMVDKTACTYCGHFVTYAFIGIAMAKNKDKHFDDIEILTGKIMEPTPGHKHTLLFGQCQVKKNAKNPMIKHGVAVKGCPPSKKGFIEAYEELGIELPDNPIEWIYKVPEYFMGQYIAKPEFDEAFYRIH